MIWSINLEVVFNGALNLLVQGFLTYRVYLLSYKNRLLTGALAILVFGLFTLQLVYTILALQLVTIVQLERLKGMAMTVDIMAAVLDLLLAVTLCYLLHKSRTGFKTTDTTISRVMLFTVNTGLMTSICATVTVITFLEFPKALIYVAFYFLGGRLYTNSLLATLNSRNVSHSAEDDGDSLWFTLGPTTTSGAVETTKGSKNNIAIKINTTSDTCRDGAKTPCFHTVASHEFSSDKKPTNDTAV
jgi:hypothetical protein